MSEPLQQDIEKSFDPSGYASISGSQLAELIDGATPADDKGFVIVTQDVAGNPVVPNANTTPRWQRYAWVRQSATSVGLYVWNPTGASEATFLKWQSVNVSGIAAGSIQNFMIADNTIQSIKIVSLDYSKLTGAPTGLPPSGSAGGDLTGTYPNPVVGPGVITTSKIAVLNITNALLENASATAGIQVTKLAPVSGSAKDMARVNGAVTGMEAFTPPSIFTDANVTTVGNVGKVPTVATSGAGDTGTWVMSSPTAIGRILQIIETQDSTPDSTALTCTTATLPTTANTKQPAGLTAAITPISSTSTLLVEVGMSIAGAGATTTAALFKDAGANAIAAGTEDSVGTSKITAVLIHYKEVSGSLTARTFKTGFTGAASTAYNSTDGVTKPFGGTLGINSWIKVTEYI